jgi:hypothetical protein
MRFIPQTARGNVWALAVTALVLATSLIAYSRSNAVTYEDALARFRVLPSSSDGGPEVGDSLRAHMPRGTSLEKVERALDSLGFTRVPVGARVSTPHFYVESRASEPFIYAEYPYDESFLSIARFFCERPALRITVVFDPSRRLNSISARSVRACI